MSEPFFMIAAIIAVIIVAVVVLYLILRREARELQRLREHAEFYQSLFEQNPNGVFIVDLQGTFLKTNGATHGLLGYTNDELIGQPFLSVVLTSEDRSRLNQSFEQAMRGESLTVDLTAVHREGELINASVTIIPIVIRQEVKGLFGVIQDITARHAAEEALQKTNRTLEAIIDAAPLAIYALDPDGKVSMWNHGTERISGWTVEETLGRTNPMVPPDRLDEYKAVVQRIVSEGRLDGVELQRQRKDGSLIDVSVWGSVLRDAEGKVTGIIVIASDITDQKRHELARRESEDRYRGLVELSPDAIVVHRNFVVQYANPAALRLFGAADVFDFQGKSVMDVVDAKDRAFVRDEYIRASQPGTAVGQSMPLEVDLQRLDGSVFTAEVLATLVHYGGNQSILTLIRDVTERKELESRLRQMAYHDALTGLPNRTMFHETFTSELMAAASREQKVGLMLLDFDRFKVINDKYGHAFGDLMLKLIGEKLKSAVPDYCMVARLGGDEFTILVPAVRDAADMLRMSEEVLAVFQSPVTMQGSKFTIQPSVGIALFPGDGNDPDALIKRADAAMYQAKGAGGNQTYFYAPELTELSPDIAFQPDS